MNAARTRGVIHKSAVEGRKRGREGGRTKGQRNHGARRRRRSMESREEEEEEGAKSGQGRGGGTDGRTNVQDKEISIQVFRESVDEKLAGRGGFPEIQTNRYGCTTMEPITLHSSEIFGVRVAYVRTDRWIIDGRKPPFNFAASNFSLTA